MVWYLVGTENLVLVVLAAWLAYVFGRRAKMDDRVSNMSAAIASIQTEQKHTATKSDVLELKNYIALILIANNLKVPTEKVIDKDAQA